MFQVNLNRKEVLRFFDEPSDSGKHATAVCAVMGEDLGVALLKHYLKRQDVETEANVLCQQKPRSVPKYVLCNDPTAGKPIVPTTGGSQGSRLDRWLRVKKPSERAIYYQVEIKNWSIHSLGGKCLPTDILPKDLVERKKCEWKKL